MTCPSWWPARMPWDPESDPVQHPDGRITLNGPPGPDGELLRAEVDRVVADLPVRENPHLDRTWLQRLMEAYPDREPRRRELYGHLVVDVELSASWPDRPR